MSPEPTEDDGIVEFPVEVPSSEFVEDPSDKPNQDLAESPEPDSVYNSSPHPNRDSSTSAIGLAGGAVGGGGRGGSGGVFARRARGAGARSMRAQDQAIESVRSAVPNPGTMRARVADKMIGELNLVGTSVKAKVTGSLASTQVTQTFTNTFDQPIEAVYTFPLPADGAVNEFVMQVGERRIVGIVRPRAEAEQAYKEARARGFTASLMTQERPNIFTQNVANIAKDTAVKVRFTFFQMLSYRDGRFEYVFPLTIGPRYIPPAAPVTSNEADPVGMEGTEKGNERVPDAGNITPPTLPAETRTGRDVDIEVELAPGLPLDMTNLVSVAHKVKTNLSSDGRATVRLVPENTIANRDFVLRWRVLGEQPQAAVWTHSDDRGAFASVQLHPQVDPADVDVTPREITFVLDVSGSMSGEPTRISKEVVTKVLDHLRPDDRFNIVTFAGDSESLFDSPVDKTAENMNAARSFLDGAQAGGGTNMLEGFKKALATPKDSRYLGIYAFLTDGFISNESEIHALARENAGSARSFAFGIGSSVNRHLCDGLAEHGQGKAIYCLPRDGEYASGAVESFFTAIDSPVLCDIRIDWGELDASAFAPAVPRDLFAGEPLQLCARVEGKGKHTITMHGRVGGRAVALPVEIDLDAAESHPAIAAIWARRTVDDLSAKLLQDPANTVTVQEITDLGVQFNLVTKYTAFIAVDESRVNSDGQPLRIMVPVEMPEGVTFAEATGETTPQAVKIEKWGLTLYERNGAVYVAAVDEGSPAAKMGMVPVQQLLRVNGFDVTSLEQVERLLLQSTGSPELETRVNDEGRSVDAKFKLPDPA